MSKILSASVPEEVSSLIEEYSKSKRLTKSHILREIVIGELSIHEIRSALSKETADK